MTIDQFIALNEEIAALVRAGVPLDQGLAALGDDMPGRLGDMASTLAERSARGEPLEQAILDETAGFSPAFAPVHKNHDRAFQEPGGDRLVEPRNDDSKPAARGANDSLVNVRHDF